MSAGAAQGPALSAGAADRVTPACPGGHLLGLGIDAVDVARLDRVLARRPRLEARLFTAGELAYGRHLANPGPALAGRFAAKEAVMKALGCGLGAFDWWDVEVQRLQGGQPALLVRGRAAELAGARGVTSWQVSITHTDAVACAVVAALA